MNGRVCNLHVLLFFAVKRKKNGNENKQSHHFYIFISYFYIVFLTFIISLFKILKYRLGGLDYEKKGRNFLPELGLFS